ncbi:MAG: DUF6435 family protein [Rhodothermales bacterium]
MFSFLSRNPIRALEKQYNSLLIKARDAQRAGDIKAYATWTAEAEAVWGQIEALRKSTS